MAEITLTTEQMEQLTQKFLASWLADDTPYSVKNAIEKAVADELVKSGAWAALASLISERFCEKRFEIASAIVEHMTKQLVGAMSHVVADVCRKVGDELTKSRGW